MAEAKLTEVVVNYNVSVKANIGNYESASVGVSTSERWDVSKLSTEEAAKLEADRYEELKTLLDARVQKGYEELMGGS